MRDYGDQIDVGRDSTNEIVINDSEISRRHARLTFQGGKYVLEDLGSTNGTFINGVQVTDVNLEPDQHIQLGNVTVLFEADAPVSARVADAPPPPPPPPPGVRIAATPPAAPSIRSNIAAASSFRLTLPLQRPTR